MNNKGNMFKGLSAADLHPTFRADLSSFSAIPHDKASLLAQIMVADANQLSPTSLSTLAKDVSTKLRVQPEEARSFVRTARSFATRLADTDDDPAALVGDLLGMQVISPAGKDVLLTFLGELRKHRAELTGRENRKKNALGGGFHLGNWFVYTDYRIAFDKFDIRDVDLNTYQPAVTGLIPVVTLEIEIHSREEEKTFAIRLPEADLARLETALKVARLQLTAMKKYSQRGE